MEDLHNSDFFLKLQQPATALEEVYMFLSQWFHNRKI